MQKFSTNRPNPLHNLPLSLQNDIFMLFKHQVSYEVGELRGWWYGGLAFSIMVNGRVNGNYEQTHKEKID